MSEEEETPMMKWEREFAQALEEPLEKARIAFGIPPFLQKAAYDAEDKLLTLHFSDRSARSYCVPTLEAALAEVQAHDPNFTLEP